MKTHDDHYAVKCHSRSVLTEYWLNFRCRQYGHTEWPLAISRSNVVRRAQKILIRYIHFREK